MDNNNENKMFRFSTIFTLSAMTSAYVYVCVCGRVCVFVEPIFTNEDEDEMYM